ncbi:MAG: hypothetical protein M3N29_07855 [Chloroflexota bacterium]|nr:hypothetical protein [Chloroflexota bacterium]
MADRAPVEMSPALAEALHGFARFLVADDVERSGVISHADDATLRDLVATMEPLYDEVNAALDVLVEHPHPLPGDQELLEEQLNALGQAGMEAQFELEARVQ